MELSFCKIRCCSFLNIFAFCLVLLFLLPNAKAESHSEQKSAPLDIGGMIIDHVVNSYEWHIATIGEKHISISLPVILIDKEGLHVFSSGRFHHGHEAYNGYAICQEEGMSKGKIVKVNEAGLIDTNASFVDISITKNVFSLLFGIVLLLILFISVARGYAKRGVGVPKGMARLVEPVILFVRDDIARSAIGEKHQRYLPFLLTLFFFILFNNLLGLIPFFPGGANLTGNISVTLVLALFTFIITNVSGNKTYWKDIVNTPGVPWWLKFPLPLMPLVEIIGLFTKPVVLMIRLFANITAGHIICLGFISLIFIFGNMVPVLGYGLSPVSVVFYIFMSLLELLVAFIQAFVFTLLSAIYIGMAIAEHHQEEHKPEHAVNEVK
ncbi:MAG: F0F1 ATP synthase subunit A [Bacteroidales bacterium]|jgi:F-type H+-transporting ATPase subunit a|nr:F0F1 ATP synthase subunit A [Bacteroidales bacterium]